MPLETSTSTASVPPTGDLSLQDNTGLLVHSDAPEIPSPILPAPVLEDILPRGMLPTLSLPWLILTNRLARISILNNG
jgi:hypothetical protein